MDTKEKTCREKVEERECRYLSEFATKSVNSKGRKIAEEKCPLRTDFQRDRDRIIHSRAFRRLKHKTQAFLSPFDDHFRTRLTHTLEVAQIARTIARALDLNEDLTEAIALGHDLGHTPFGHCGERVLDSLMPNGFAHNIQSVRVVEVLEKLNLCQETISGIFTHSWGFEPKTLEAQTVQLADKIAYINHDIDDSILAGIITENDLPKDCTAYFSAMEGDYSIKKKRLTKMIQEIIKNSVGKDKVTMSDEAWGYTNKLRDWMFDNIYMANSSAKSEEGKASHIIEELYNYYLKEVSKEHDETRAQRIVCDYISGMSDGSAIEKFREIFIPYPKITKIKDTALIKLAQITD
ncbi:deoxyguanosinetriphosphate triphosphohydrolase [bacterium]|nr:deoxyguanosinetriphosphate triphosphohydrolase [bacterium]